MRPINRTLIVYLREIYSSFLGGYFMTPLHCSSKETEVTTVVGTLTLVIVRSRSGEPRPSSDFREFISLNFLALSAISGIKFP